MHHGGEETSPKPSGLSKGRAKLGDHAPTEDTFTPYDESHFAVYLSLLHASAEGVDADAMCLDILGIDPTENPARASATLKSHLDRALWLSANGRAKLLEDRADNAV